MDARYVRNTEGNAESEEERYGTQSQHNSSQAVKGWSTSTHMVSTIEQENCIVLRAKEQQDCYYQCMSTA